MHLLSISLFLSPIYSFFPFNSFTHFTEFLVSLSLSNFTLQSLKVKGSCVINLSDPASSTPLLPRVRGHKLDMACVSTTLHVTKQLQHFPHPNSHMESVTNRCRASSQICGDGSGYCSDCCEDAAARWETMEISGWGSVGCKWCQRWEKWGLVRYSLGKREN